MAAEHEPAWFPAHCESAVTQVACRAGGLANTWAGDYLPTMRGEFTAVIEAAEEGGYWATCPEVPGANGQGETVAEAKQSLAEAIRLILEDRLEDALRGLPREAIRDVVTLQ